MSEHMNVFLQWLPITLKKNKSTGLVSKRPFLIWHLSHWLISCYILPHTFCSSHAGLIGGPQGTMHACASGPLHLLFLLLGTLLPWHSPCYLFQFHQGQISPYRDPPCPSYINLPLWSNFIPLTYFISFIECVTTWYNDLHTRVYYVLYSH